MQDGAQRIAYHASIPCVDAVVRVVVAQLSKRCGLQSGSGRISYGTSEPAEENSFDLRRHSKNYAATVGGCVRLFWRGSVEQACQTTYTQETPSRDAKQLTFLMLT
jgi:hypothetical protein